MVNFRKILTLGGIVLASCAYTTPYTCSPQEISAFSIKIQDHSPEIEAPKNIVLPEGNLEKMLGEDTRVTEQGKPQGKNFLSEKEIRGLISEAMKYNKRIPPYLDENFFYKIVMIESDGNSNACSPSGAEGLMQLTDSILEDLELSKKDVNFYDPATNIKLGIEYFACLDKRYFRRIYPNWESLPKEKKWELLAAAYNGGIGQLRRNDFDTASMPTQTQNYIKKIAEF